MVMSRMKLKTEALMAMGNVELELIIDSKIRLLTIIK